MHNRVQLSLIVEDNDVYDNLIVPAKQNKDLHPLCIRLLSAYYYNEEVRNLVDGVSEDYDEVSDSPVMDAINNLRNNLAMQAFLGSDLAQVIENGADDIASIANGGTVNVTSENSNIKVEFTKNSAGNTNVRLLTNNQEVLPDKNLTKEEPKNSKEPDALFLINYLARKLNIDLSGAYSDSSDLVDVKEEVSAVSETVIQEEKTQVGLNEDIIKEENPISEPIEMSEPINKSIAEVEPVAITETVSFDEEFDTTEDDASDAIDELLGSLFM